MEKYFLLPLLFILFLNATGQYIKKTNIDQDKNLILYIEDSSISGDRKQLFLKNFSKNLNIPLLVDTINLSYNRIWLWGGEKKYVIDIINDSLKFYCNILEFNTRNINGKQFILIHRRINNCIPKSGWRKFYRILETSILSLEGGNEFGNQVDFPTNMSYIQFEVVAQKKYRYFEYLEPSYYRKVDNGSKNVYEFLNYFNREMNLNIYKPTKSIYVKPGENPPY